MPRVFCQGFPAGIIPAEAAMLIARGPKCVLFRGEQVTVELKQITRSVAMNRKLKNSWVFGWIREGEKVRFIFVYKDTLDEIAALKKEL